MPRNAAGQYTLPAGNPVVADTLIESDGWANPTMEDLGAEIEDSLSRDGKGSMRSALGIVDGSEANPGMRFIAETGSGLYRESDGRWWLVVKGVQKILVSELAGIQIDDALTITGDLTVTGSGGLTVAPLKVFGVADEVQAIIRGDVGQSENLQEWQDDAANLLAWIESDGRPAWMISATPGTNHAYHFENDDTQIVRVKNTEENGGADVLMQDIISSSGGNAFKARYTHGANTSADEAEVSLLQQTGGGNIPGLAWETSNVGAGFNRAHVKRLSGGQTANLHEWRDETGAVMAAIDKDGNFVGGPGGGGSGGNTPDNSGNVPVGAIMHWPLTPPLLGTEWLICDGANYPDATYPALSAYLGTAYGMTGGAGTFNVPDYRGNFLRGQDMGAGVDPQAGIRTDRGDGTTGDAPGTRQAEDVLATAIGVHTHLYLGVAAGPLAGGGGFAGVMTPTGPAIGGGTGVETRPVNVYTVIAIKAV